MTLVRVLYALDSKNADITRRFYRGHIVMISWCWYLDLFLTLDMSRIDNYKLDSLAELLDLRVSHT